MSQLNDYQNLARATAGQHASQKAALAVWALGLGGEAGEVQEHIKKHLGHGKPLDTEKVALELGDVLWYVALMTHQIGYTLEEVAEMNIDKLRQRWPDGFPELH